MNDRAGTRDRRAAHDARRARRGAVTDPAIVLEAAAQFLAVRSRSVAETRRRLLHLGYAEGVTDEALASLGRMGYLDDHAFARAWVESRDRSRPRGETALRQELRRKGVDEAIVRTILQERGHLHAQAGAGDEPAWGAGRSLPVHADDGEDGVGTSADRTAAARLLARRTTALAREPDVRKRRQKAYALLARNGFDPGVCRDLSARLAGDPDGDADDPGDGDHP